MTAGNKDVVALFEELAANPNNTNDGTDLWPLISAVAITAAGSSEHIIPLFHAARSRLPNAQSKVTLLQRMKEAFAKTTSITSQPRMMQTIYALAPLLAELGETDPESVTTKYVRSYMDNPFDYKDRGTRHLRAILADDSEEMIAMGERFYPDVMLQAIVFTQGVFLSEESVLSLVDTFVVHIAALVPMDSPTQLVWNMRALLRNGGTLEQLEFARGLSGEVVRLLGWPLTKTVPTLDISGPKLEADSRP